MALRAALPLRGAAPRGDGAPLPSPGRTAPLPPQAPLARRHEPRALRSLGARREARGARPASPFPSRPVPRDLRPLREQARCSRSRRGNLRPVASGAAGGWGCQRFWIRARCRWAAGGAVAGGHAASIDRLVRPWRGPILWPRGRRGDARSPAVASPLLGGADAARLRDRRARVSAMHDRLRMLFMIDLLRSGSPPHRIRSTGTR